MTSSARRSSASRIDLWVAARLPNDPAVDRWRTRMGVTLADARPLVDEVNAAGLHDDRVSGPERVIALFGPPTFARSNRLVYDLALWPAHQFVWAISAWGDVAALGMRLRDAVALPPLGAAGVEGASATFRLWHHTEHEVRLVWGKPDQIHGNPQRAWHWSYTVPRRAHRLKFGFAWGLLYEIVADGGRQGWHPLDPARSMHAPWLPSPAHRRTPRRG